MNSEPITVGFDITPILYNRGVSRYTSNIVRALAALEGGPDLTLFGSSFRANKALRSQAAALIKASGIRQKATVLAFPPSFLKTMWYTAKRLHIESLMRKVDVFHAWEELVPPSYKTPIVATIHDLAQFKFPETVNPLTKEKHEAALKRLLGYRSHVIAVSQQTKRDLLELFSFPEDHVHVVSEAMPVEHIVSKKNIGSRKDLERLGVSRPYFLWVGVNEPRKNIKRLLQAVEPFAKDFDLVLVGTAGLHTVVPRQGVIVVPNASREQLASLYTYASALTFPSIYEGFGLPILEAFYYGCPVLTSNNSGMSETAGDAAVLVDPFEIESISSGIRQIVQKGKLSSMQEKMKKRLLEFSWEKSARATLSVYRKAKIDTRR